MNEMNQKFCQCCGMPMGETDELYGTNADGSKMRNTASIVLKTVGLLLMVRWKK